MADVTSRYSEGLLRQANAMVAALGGTTIRLRLPAPAPGGVDGEQLGLTVPLFTEVPVSPAGARGAAKTTEWLIPGRALELALGLEGEGAVRASLDAVIALLAGDEVFEITAVQGVQAFGRTYLYVLSCVPDRG